MSELFLDSFQCLVVFYTGAKIHCSVQLFRHNVWIQSHRSNTTATFLHSHWIYYIYKCKIEFESFLQHLRFEYETEKCIAMRNRKAEYFYKRWKTRQVWVEKNSTIGEK